MDTVEPGDAALAGLPGLPPPGPATSARPRRIHPLVWFILRRLGAGVLMLAVVSVVVFAATEILPGDAATAILGRDASPDAVAAMRHELGLDRPVIEQYLSWVGGLLHGDLGRSLTSDLPVSELIGSRIVNTLILAVVASLVMIPLAVALGVIAGRRPAGAADSAISWTLARHDRDTGVRASGRCSCSSSRSSCSAYRPSRCSRPTAGRSTSPPCSSCRSPRS